MRRLLLYYIIFVFLGLAGCQEVNLIYWGTEKIIEQDWLPMYNSYSDGTWEQVGPKNHMVTILGSSQFGVISFRGDKDLIGTVVDIIPIISDTTFYETQKAPDGSPLIKHVYRHVNEISIAKK